MPIALDIGRRDRAASLFERKRAVGTDLSSAEITARVPHYAREVGFFSARLADAKKAAGLKGLLEDVFKLPPDKAFAGKAGFIADARKLLGAEPGDSGELTDHTSEKRLGLIYDTQLESTYNAARAEMESLHPELLDEWPAQEFIRVESRRVERADWPQRWQAAGGSFFGGRMIALKNDPVWTELSVFGNPWPPFDFGSGMGVRDIDRQEAIGLGLIKEGWKFPRDEKPYTNNMWEMSQSAKDVDADTLAFLKEHFSGALKVVPPDKAHPNGLIVLTPQKLQEEVIRKREVERAIRKTLPLLSKDEAFDQYVEEHPFTTLPDGRKAVTELSHLDDSRQKDREERKKYAPAAFDVLASPAAQVEKQKDGTEKRTKVFHGDGVSLPVSVLLRGKGDGLAFFDYFVGNPKYTEAAPKDGNRSPGQIAKKAGNPKNPAKKA